MKFSIITASFNSASTIGKNAASIILQTYKNFEQVIVDNSSIDNTVEIIKSLYSSAGLENNLKIISEKDEGISDAFNKGIRASSGDIIGILNSDDSYFNNDVLQRVADVFVKNNNILFVHGNIFFNDPEYGSNIRKPLLCNVTEAMPYNHTSMFFKKEAFDKFGFYNHSYKSAMDYEFIIRLHKKISLNDVGVYLPDPPLVYMNAGGISWKNEIETLMEGRRALKSYGLWNLNAKKNYFKRVVSVKLKKAITNLGANKLIKVWRRKKWGN
jgi:glycosyltransferase involved in cell wall biosynthesis